MNAQTPEEIDQVIKKAFEPPTEDTKTFSHEADVSGIDLTDNSEEEALLKQDSRRDGVTVPELPDTKEREPSSLFDSDPVAEAQAIVGNAFRANYDFASVEIDVIERDRFYRCGLHDEEMWYLVEVPEAGLSVRVAIPPVSRSEAAVAALDHWQAEKFIGKNSIQYLHGFQLLNVWLMVREVNGVPTDWYEKAVEDAGGKLPYRKLRAMLCDPDTVDPVRDLHERRWNALTLAVRIADYKHQLCLEALRSRKVFTTAGSA